MVNRTKHPGTRHLLAAGRHPTRRDGAIATAAFLLPWVTALVLVRRHHYLDGGTVAILVAVGLGLPTLWVTWAAYRGPRGSGAPGSGLNMAQMADELAVAVSTQWNDEASMRRLNDPYPLPVSWAEADPSLTDTWDSMVRLATSGAGWPPPPDSGIWAAGPEDLAGEGGELAEVLARVPTRRLVVLGEPGAGKTMLMVRLVLDLLALREGGGPVPVLVSVASWNPTDQDLRDWLGAQLRIDHPALASPPPDGVTGSTQAEALLAAGLILPILDGLDEIPEQARDVAISRINDALRPGDQLVMTCRTEQYRDSVRPQCSAEVILRAAAAVQLLPLDAYAVRCYLRGDAAGPVARARWDPVVAALGTDAPAGHVLTTPLMVGLARIIYNPRPGELAGTLRDPAELCDFADRAAVEAHLFDAFIPAAYRPPTGSRWTAMQAETWLEFLARHLEQTIGEHGLAWWQLHKAAPASWGLVDVGPARGMGLNLSQHYGRVRVALGLVAALPFGLILGLASGLSGHVVGLPVGLMIGLASGLAVGLAFGLAGVPADLTEVTTPRAILRRDRRVALLLFMLAGVPAGALASIFPLAAGLGLAAEMAVGLTVGLGFSRYETAWPSYIQTRGWLALHHRLPWSLMHFLSDAHQRGVLRQAGAVYQFRHIGLQHRLVNRDANEQQTSSSAAPPEANG